MMQPRDQEVLLLLSHMGCHEDLFCLHGVGHFCPVFALVVGHFCPVMTGQFYPILLGYDRAKMPYLEIV
jgi:hypothetical protein